LPASDGNGSVDIVRFARPVLAVLNTDTTLETSAFRGNRHLSAFPSFPVNSEPLRPKEARHESLAVSSSPLTVAPQTHAKVETPATDGFVDELASAISQQIREHREDGPTSLRFQFHRADLGKLDLLVSISRDHVVSVRITTHDERARQVVQSQIHDLRQALTDSGVEFGQFEVSCNSGQRQSSNSSFSSFRDRSGAASTAVAPPKNAGRTILKAPTASSSRRINYVA
jgi:hypothetical protein